MPPPDPKRVADPDYLPKSKAALADPTSSQAFKDEIFNAHPELRPLYPGVKAPEISGLESLGRGAAQGATMDWGDEAVAKLMSLTHPDETGIPRHYAAGSEAADLQKTFEQENREAQKANPKLYMTGEVVGSSAPAALTSAIPGGGAVASRFTSPVLKVLAPMLAGGATGGVYGAVAGAGAAPEGEKVQGAVRGAETGAVAGATVPAVLQALGPVARGLASMASKRRVLAAGATPAEVSQMGSKGAQELGQGIEAQKIHGEGVLAHGPEAYREQAEKAIERGKTLLDQVTKEADQVKLTVDMQPLADSLKKQAAKEALAPSGKEAAAALEKRAGLYNKPVTLEGAHQEYQKLLADGHEAEAQLVRNSIDGSLAQYPEAKAAFDQATDAIRIGTRVKALGKNADKIDAMELLKHLGPMVAGGSAGALMHSPLLGGAIAGPDLAMMMLKKFGVPVPALQAGGLRGAAAVTRGTQDLANNVPGQFFPAVAGPRGQDIQDLLPEALPAAH